jgi:excisionase family DNA binding protein
MSDQKILLTVPEVAALIGFAEGTIRHWVSEQRIPYVRFSNRCVRFRREDIEHWILEMTVTVRDANRAQHQPDGRARQKLEKYEPTTKGENHEREN